MAINKRDHSVCPVCRMEVSKTAYKYEFLKKEHVFCSKQCMQRFIDNPHLYVGHPAKPSAKQRDLELIKIRTLNLSEALSDSLSVLISNELIKMMGVKDVRVENNNIYITYDLLQATEKQIECMIAASGGVLGKSLAEKIKRAFVHYLEESELDNVESSSNYQP
jgi:YHS domain-containing protein